MNGYLRSKCSSEQQLLNELAKLLANKEVTSRKMVDLLRALTFFYTSTVRGSRLSLSLLSGLCTLLPMLKDKKEFLLLKDEHLRIARIAICLLTRLIDQYELEKTNLTESEQINRDQNVDPVEQVLQNFMPLVETTVMVPWGLLLPRQRVTMRLYAQLCRIFDKRHRLIDYTTALVQQSPVLAFAESPLDARGKRVLPPMPAHFGAIAGACHLLRFHTAPDEQLVVVNNLVQLAFMLPVATASRHAAKILLSHLSSPMLSEDRTSNAVSVAKTIEIHLLKARPRTLLDGDSLTSIYLLRLCGQLIRLPLCQSQHSRITSRSNSEVFDNSLASLATSPDVVVKQSSDRTSVSHVFSVSDALLVQLRKYFVDIIQDFSTNNADVAPTMLLVAVEELLRGSSPETSFRKQPDWASKNMFELVTAALLPLLPAPNDPDRTMRKSLTLHRVCRAVQFVAESLDAAALQINKSLDQPIEIATNFNQLIPRVQLLTSHSNGYVACEALRAFVWLLPRCSSVQQDRQYNTYWATLFLQLETLPFRRVQPEHRAAIAWTLFRRCVTTLNRFGYRVEAPLLQRCLRVVLVWFRAQPCLWHAAMLTAIWHAALCEWLLEPLGNAVFSSINELLDYQCSPYNSTATDSHVVKQSTLAFLGDRDKCLKFAVRREAWYCPLIMRLMKQSLLEKSTSQRLGIRALSQLCKEARLQKCVLLADQVKLFLSAILRPTQLSQQDEVSVGERLETLSRSRHGEPIPEFTAPENVPITSEEPFFNLTSSGIALRNVDTLSNEVGEHIFADSNCIESDVVTSRKSATTEDVVSTILDSESSFKNATHRDFDDDVCYAPPVSVEMNVDFFSGWKDDDNTQLGKVDDTSFGNFSEFESSVDASFAAWGENATNEMQESSCFSDIPELKTLSPPSPTPAATMEFVSGQAEQTEENAKDASTAYFDQDFYSVADNKQPTRLILEAQGDNGNGYDLEFEDIFGKSGTSAAYEEGNVVASKKEDIESDGGDNEYRKAFGIEVRTGTFTSSYQTEE